MSKQSKKAKAKLETEAKGLIVNQEVVLARAFPDGKSEMVAFLHRGKEVSVTGSEGDYYKISVNVECFIPKRFVALVENEPQPVAEEVVEEKVEAEGE